MHHGRGEVMSDSQENECSAWLEECIKAFPKLKDYKISCRYAMLRQNLVFTTHSSVTTMRNVEPEEVLLKGDSNVTITRKESKSFKIDMNQNLRKIRIPILRKQVVQYYLISELVRIDNLELVVVSKEGERAKRRCLPKKEFEEKLHQKFNELRAASGLPPIGNMENVEKAISKILSEITFE